MSRKIQDTFFKQAKRDGFLARSAYKLLEIQQRHRVIPKGGNVLDLGCSPGAWLQVAAQATSGRLVGIDLQECKEVAGLINSRQLVLIQGDVLSMNSQLLLDHSESGFNTVLSDLCHSTIGNTPANASRSLHLGGTAAALALGSSFAAESEMFEPITGEGKGVLKKGGSFVVKLLEGPGFQELRKQLKPCFAKLHNVRPKATRPESKEIFLVGLGRRTP